MYQPSSELRALLAQHSFIEITSSKAAYPGSAGEGLPLLQIKTPLCQATISLQGAHLLEFQPKNGSPLLWLSPNCKFSEGTALRGGIPLCLPWFGPNRLDPKKPKHGFARNEYWDLQTANLSDSGECHLTFGFFSKANDLFAYDFSAELSMTLGKTAKVELAVTNRSDTPFSYSWALHSYHPVAALAEVHVTGLAGRTYLDNLESHAKKMQHGDLTFDGEVDRVFPAIENPLTIVGQPNITITNHNCPSVITWNPGPENAANIADIGAGNEKNYICVERGAVLDEQWQLAPGETKSGWLEIGES